MMSLAAAGLSLVGCVSDGGFSSLIGANGHDGEAFGVGHRPPDVGPHPGHPPNNSRWGHLDPGSLPDVYFAVAYTTVPYGWYTCDAYCDADQAEVPYYPYGETHYAVIDLKGQVVWDVPALSSGMTYEHLALAAAGPGQFSVTARPWYTYDAEADADGWYAGTNWEAYRLDALTMSTERVAHFDLERWVTHIDRASVDVDVGPADGTLHLGMFPSDPERALFLGTDTYSCDATARGVRDLRSVHLNDGEASAISYDAASFLPNPDAHWWAWGFDASVDEDGAPAALIGVTPWDCSALTGDPQVVMWSPERGALWTADLGPNTWPLDAEFDPREGGGALSFAVDPVDGRALWRVFDADGRAHGELGDELYNWRPGPLLEHASSTFVDVGTRSSDGFDQIEIRSDGRVVWRIDDLRFGVGRQAVSILDIVLLPM